MQIKREQVKEFLEIASSVRSRCKKFNDAMESVSESYFSLSIHYDYENFITNFIKETRDSNYVDLIDQFLCDLHYDKYSWDEAREKWFVKKSESGEHIMWTDFENLKTLDSYKRITDVDEFLDYISLYDKE